jgi:hypothetical protein
VIPQYEKFGDEGHLYIVKPLQGGLDHTAPEAYVLVLFSIYVPENYGTPTNSRKTRDLHWSKGRNISVDAGKLPTRGGSPCWTFH